MQKIRTCLWFDDDALDAAKFYCSIFKDAKVLDVQRYSDAGPGKKGTVMAIVWKMAGQEFQAINGGPIFPLTEAVSLSVRCKDQKEVDDYWKKLLRGGGTPSQCGWLKDRYGLSWQIVPEPFAKKMKSRNEKKVASMFRAMFTMQKLDLKKLEAAYERG